MSTQSSAPAPSASGSSALDLDAIIKEIEELEKQMDHQEVVSSGGPQAQAVPSGAGPIEESKAPAPAPGLRLVDQDSQQQASSNVLSASPAAGSSMGTIKPSDEFPRPDAMNSSLPPLLETPVTQSQFSSPSPSLSKNHLQLKLDGCTRLELTFEVSGQAITVECSDHEFIIRTDRGAEFRLPVS